MNLVVLCGTMYEKSGKASKINEPPMSHLTMLGDNEVVLTKKGNTAP